MIVDMDELMRVTTPQDMGNVVHDRRVARGLTQSELAEMANVSRMWLHQVENGHGGASLAKLLQLLGVLELSLDVRQRETSRLSLRAPMSQARRKDRDELHRSESS